MYEWILGTYQHEIKIKKTENLLILMSKYMYVLLMILSKPHGGVTVEANTIWMQKPTWLAKHDRMLCARERKMAFVRDGKVCDGSCMVLSHKCWCSDLAARYSQLLWK